LWKEKEWSSTIHFFNPLAETWTTSECSGTPPLGLGGCSCASEGHSLFIYGGKGVEGDCQSTLHKLNTLRCEWTLLSSDGPKKNRSSDIVKFRNSLFLFGRFGDQTAEFEEGYDGQGWTNEIYTFDLTKSEWAWKVGGGGIDRFCIPWRERRYRDDYSPKSSVWFPFKGKSLVEVHRFWGEVSPAFPLIFVIFVVPECY
jgi:hypothetical protein